ncbi:lactonase family protein [Albibacterium indicum]|uniref:lactonase family protein n=1 Tax=Albibacterium indicum TaxID=2292082 RepID=UPI000E50EDA3|nr:lactonase family protein [Pedobacter indicus]
MRTLIVVCILLSSCNMATTSTDPSQGKLTLLIGTYTGSGDHADIYVYTFDTDSGTLTYKNELTGIDNPSFLTLSPDLKQVYAVSEWGKDSIGTVYAYNFDQKSGKMEFLNKVSSGGDGPCYISIDSTGTYVFTANYGSGSLAAVPILEDGSLSNDIQAIYHKGNIVNGKEGPTRMHAAAVSPDNNTLFVTNLGTSEITGYPLNVNQESFPLDTNNLKVSTLPENSGPRHFTFHPNGQHAYFINELNGDITVFDYEDGVLTEKQKESIVPDDFAGKFAAADIHVSPDGKFLYGSNRLELNEIIIFKVNPTDGQLSYVGRQSSGGETPRNFAIDPSGKFLLVANQNTNDITVFLRDQETGLLSETSEKISIHKPVCLKFAH